VRLAEVVQSAGLPVDAVLASSNREAGQVRYDSRAVAAGDIFVAVRGTVTDGHRFVVRAVGAGAALVVVEDEIADPGVPCLRVPSSRQALADLAAARHGFPSLKLHITGITGTDGKTTSAFLLSHMLEHLGYCTGLLSTVAFKFGEQWEDNSLRQSTLEAPEVQGALAKMACQGVGEAIVEVTSHGLALDRVRQCLFDQALVTNITSEHLEFHGTRERYIAAKALLLEAVHDGSDRPGPHFAAINCDDPGSAGLIGGSPVEVVTFGLSDGARVRALDLSCDASGSAFTVAVDGGCLAVRTTLPGIFNVYNCLGVLALLAGRGDSVEAAVPALASFLGVPGRMNRVDEGQEFTVIVDYAHTAASLEKVLRTLRPLASGRLIVVFGSAGDRDREKRPAMGAVALEQADLAVITDEDPRTEPSAAILAEIAAGARAAGGREGAQFHLIADRRAAIDWAIQEARPEDVVLLAGKGHEQNMFMPEGSVPWDEAGVARAALRRCGYGH
jgi:UDP-N-acetylmuramoyl-L-alanyl-D-glutamate--2,6-diaminopimelate ligase